MNDSPKLCLTQHLPGLMQKGHEIMELPGTLPAFTPDEYLAFERNSESKHEYLEALQKGLGTHSVRKLLSIELKERPI